MYQVWGTDISDPELLDLKRQALTGLLKKNHCRVTFTKVDGSERVMDCTLKESSLPVRESKETSTKKENLGVISAFCLDLNSWRSFRVAGVSRIEVLEDPATTE
jgi:WYL_2, Sm-like SH3 beta-barrel fold